jgi:inosose dehydratase
MKIGFHTDAFNSAYFSFDKCLAWALANQVHFIECGLIDGVSWIHGLGYQPHVALYEDPALLRRKMDGYNVQFSQVDAAYPLSGKDGPSRGVPYVLKSIAWAKMMGCDRVDTTDGLHAPEGFTDAQALESMKRCYEQIIEVAEAHQVTINIEPHGYFTTRPDMMEKMLGFCDSPYLRLNMDTGNTFIAGQDPLAFLKRFLKKVSHVHVKGCPRRADRNCGKPVRFGRRGERGKYPRLPGDFARCRLRWRAEHRMRRPGRAHDRKITRLAPKDTPRTEYSSLSPLTLTLLPL